MNHRCEQLQNDKQFSIIYDNGRWLLSFDRDYFRRIHLCPFCGEGLPQVDKDPQPVNIGFYMHERPQQVTTTRQDYDRTLKRAFLAGFQMRGENKLPSIDVAEQLYNHWRKTEGLI